MMMRPGRRSRCRRRSAGDSESGRVDMTKSYSTSPVSASAAMRRMHACLALIAALAACAPAPEQDAPLTFPSGELVDLTHTFDESTIFRPTSAPFRLEVVSEGITPGGYYYAANNFSTAEHGGTHLDSPVHFAEGCQTVDDIPLERLVGTAVVIDVTAHADADADYQVTVADIVRAEQQDG